MKHKGKDHHVTDKKMKKAHLTPPAPEVLDNQTPQMPKPGTNAKNQFR